MGRVTPAAEAPALLGTRPARGRGTRILGAVRLLAFAAALAMIVGTSVALASAEDRGTQRVAAAKDTALLTKDAPDAADDTADVDTTDAVDTSADSAAETTAADVATEPVVTASASDSDLPVTGPRDIPWAILAGASLLLLGMLVQIAVEPLPARSGAAARSAAR